MKNYDGLAAKKMRITSESIRNFLSFMHIMFDVCFWSKNVEKSSDILYYTTASQPISVTATLHNLFPVMSSDVTGHTELKKNLWHK